MPSKTIHLELAQTAISLDTWSHINRIDRHILQHIGDPDESGMQDGYILSIEGRKPEAGLIPHHGAKEITLVAYSYYFWNSLCYYLREDYEKAGESLGRALHYIQDYILAYTGYEALHNVVEGDIEKLWSVEKESIVREIKPELRIIANRIDQGNYDIKFEPASMPRLYLVNSLKSTYYLLKLFDKMVDLAKNLVPKLVKRKRLYRVILIVSLPLLIIPPLGIAMLIIGLIIRWSVKKYKYLLWATGHENLNITMWNWTTAKQTRDGTRYITQLLKLQPYVKPCRT